MKSAAAILLLFSASAAWAGAAPNEDGRLLDRIVAVVNGRVLTQSRVIIEAMVIVVRRIEKKGLKAEVEAGKGVWPRLFAVLQGHDPENAGEKKNEIKITPKLLDSILDLMINQTVILNEAERLKFLELAQGEKTKLLESFKAGFKTKRDFQKFLGGLELDEDQLSGMLARYARVEKYVEERISLAAWPSREEVKAAGSAAGDEVTARVSRNAAATKIYKRRFKRKLQEWLKLLRAKSRIIILVKPSMPQGPIQ
ncbi:MAG: hypothetical protein GXP49_05495 [Deltaproteobacteria bacterium]|nr:hypothetical protein [Deltaproteobacteria bacterium]